MSYKDYLEEKRSIQNAIIELIENSNDSEINFQNFIRISNSRKVQENRHKLKDVLYLILKISKNHHRSSNFFQKIEKIIKFYKDSLKNHFTAQEINFMFYKNKRLLLFLYKESIITPTISDILLFYQKCSLSHIEYLFPQINGLPDGFYEAKQVITTMSDDKITTNPSEECDNNDLFERNRENGENTDYICELIRNDSIDEFVAHSTKTNLSLTTTIKPSIFETNSFLLKGDPSLIEYSAFFGSIQILKYLFLNNVEVNPSLWFYVIHGKNAELIHFLEEKNVKPPGNNYKLCFFEAIKCHHNDIAKYIRDNFIQPSSNDDFETFTYALEYSNYEFFPDDIKFKLDPNSKFNIFPLACKNGSLELVQLILNLSKVNINCTTILN